MYVSIPNGWELVPYSRPAFAFRVVDNCYYWKHVIDAQACVNTGQNHHGTDKAMLSGSTCTAVYAAF